MEGEENENKAEEIYRLRTDLRENCVEIRHRNDIVKHLWGFIKEVSNAYRCNVDWGTGSSRRRGKRKARDEDHPDEDEGTGGKGKMRRK